ncbi:MAG: DUF4365 domain-containing protein [Acidimicrobiaceae bacterium]|nr:DUF4365 domain-containing protein [Acidimicrobiaceae bacterium]MYD05419.1 DUF4365 domain-containing protein [Acidimicrobiaceae bacterium]MYI59878.1 DUF4365 domain-containing protein [Acidimicrobiaceae bacterium]
MRSQKTYSENDQIGEEGQRLVALTVTQLGHIWHDRRIDHGIDGQIELVDPLKRAATNIQILVQVKATADRFPSETDTSFHFLLEPADVAYWNGGDSKVIVICSRPRDGAVWWAPIERARPPSPRRKSWKLEFDKVADRLDEQSVGRLLLWASGATPGRAVEGRALQAETLETNLVRIEKLPPEIYFGPVLKQTPRELGQALRDRGCYRSDWIVRSGVVYTFTPPTPDGLGVFIDGGYETIDTSEWADSKDPDTLAQFAELLRQALCEQEHRSLRYHRKKRYFLFRAPRKVDRLRVKVSKSKPGRTVYERYFKDKQRTETKDFRHYAAEIRFVQTDEGWVAEVNPTYHFTFDGKRDVPWGDDRLKGMKKLEKNAAVRGLVKFWAEYLARPPELGDPDRLLWFGGLISFDVEIGINDSEWKPGPVEGEIDPRVPAQQGLL